MAAEEIRNGPLLRIPGTRLLAACPALALPRRGDGMATDPGHAPLRGGPVPDPKAPTEAARLFAAADSAGYRVSMPTSAELRLMRRMERWMGILVPRVARRVVSGKSPQPGWLPRRWLTVVSADMDLDGGIGAVWLTWRPRSPKAETRTAKLERCGGQWQYLGCGRSPGGDAAAARLAASRPGQIGMIEVGGETGGLSYAYRLRHPHPHPITRVPWVGSSELRVAAEVDHLLLGGRRIEVPGHGRLIVAWKSRLTGCGGLRPLIVAVGRDGSELSRIGPHDGVDSYTWAKLSGRQKLEPRAYADTGRAAWVTGSAGCGEQAGEQVPPPADPVAHRRAVRRAGYRGRCATPRPGRPGGCGAVSSAGCPWSARAQGVRMAGRIRRPGRAGRPGARRRGARWR